MPVPLPVHHERFRYHDPALDYLGAHVSSKGGLPTIFERGTAIGASALGLFSKNASQWNAKPLTEEECNTFAQARAGWGTGPLLVHSSYLINLCAANPEVHERSIHGLVDELLRAEQLGAQAVVLHPGAHVGAGASAGVELIARSIDRVHSLTTDCSVPILLETSAGQGSCLGCSFAELGTMLRLVDDASRLGVCVDTCHIFAAGYDIRTYDGYQRTIDELLSEVGLENVGAFHLNDSKKGLGSRVDRHTHIGEGEIGLEAFGFILNDERFRGIPKILETPKPEDNLSDIRNLGKLRSLTTQPVLPSGRVAPSSV